MCEDICESGARGSWLTCLWQDAPRPRLVCGVAGCGVNEASDWMSLADLQELDEIKGLVDRGQQLGVLTFAQVAGAVSELDLDEADVEELHGFLERAAIELVEEVDPALAAAAAGWSH